MNESQDVAVGPVIVCGADFSRGAALALRYAAAVRAVTRGVLIVVHVEDPLLKAASEAVGDRRGYPSTLEVELKAFVRQTLGRRAGQTDVRVVTGSAGAEMARFAVQRKASLVVVGTRGLGAARAMFLGSTADDLIQRSTVPVLAVPLGPGAVEPAARRGWPGPVLVAVEPGAEVPRDLRASLEAAAWLGATPMPVMVLPPGASERAIGRALDAVGTAVRRTGRAGVREMRVRSGEPVDELVKEVVRARPGLVIARRHARRGLLGLLRRSTMERALRRLVVPLLVLPDGTAWMRRLRASSRPLNRERP